MRPEQLLAGRTSRGQLAKQGPASSDRAQEAVPRESLCNLPPKGMGASPLGGMDSAHQLVDMEGSPCH